MSPARRQRHVHSSHQTDKERPFSGSPRFVAETDRRRIEISDNRRVASRAVRIFDRRAIGRKLYLVRIDDPDASFGGPLNRWRWSSAGVAGRRWRRRRSGGIGRGLRRNRVLRHYRKCDGNRGGSNQ